jgi:hypothetical protein
MSFVKSISIEVVFVSVIILFIALWQVSGLIQSHSISRNNEIYRIREGLVNSSDAPAAPAAAAAPAAPAAAADSTLDKALSLLKGSGDSMLNSIIGSPLSTEGFTPNTSENEMTIHQRRQAGTALDDTSIMPLLSAPSAPQETFIVREGLDNPDQNSKKIIDNKLTSMNPEDSQSRFKLRDYYIKTAYNAFNPEKFKNSTVSMDACLYVIARGCRCIDFEVFSVDNQPVIASSSVNSFNYKETYNHIPVSEAFEVLGSYAFSGSKCPNPGDPFIIHMRIMSRNVTMYDNLAKAITQSKTMARNLLGAKYGREYHSKDLGDEDVNSLRGKVILMVDGTNDVYRNTKLFELINMSSKSLFLSKYTFFGVKNIGDPQAFKDANKKNMCLVVPDKSGRPVNEGHNGPFTWGCQLVAMCFQEEARDEKLKAYEDKFASVGYGFILKPEDLRYVPITIAPPKPAPPEHSFENRPAEAPGVKFTL